MATGAKRKPGIREPKALSITHTCTQEEVIKRMQELLERVSRVTLGNGHEEDGLLFMFRIYLEVHKDDEDNMKEIKATIAEAIKASAQTAKALDVYKAEMAGIEAGAKDVKQKHTIAESLKLTKTRDNWYKALTILGLATAIFFGFKNSKNTEKANNNIENLGIPVVTRDGKILAMPDSTKIMFFPKGDSASYTIKKTN